jgi:hypothetical protein
MKTHGLIVADNGSDMYVSGTFDERWTDRFDAGFHSQFRTLQASDFEVVQLGWKPPPPGPAGLASRYRLYHDGTKEHHYTTDEYEYLVLGTWGWVQEGVAHRVYRDATPVGGVTPVPLYRLYHPGVQQHHWTVDSNEYDVLGSLGWIQEGVDGYILPVAVAGVTTPLYRLAHSVLPLHLWTTDANEYAVLANQGWIQEGVAGHVVP